MGRSFESVRMGIKDISARWLKASRALKKEDQIWAEVGGDGQQNPIIKKLVSMHADVQTLLHDQS